MAQTATDLYRQHRDCFDDEAWRIIENGDSPLNFPQLRYVRTAEESRALNRDAGGQGAIIIAAGGMCNGGRVLHHLKHSLWKPETHVVIVGYQAQGTLGRRLVDGAQRVSVMGEPIAVKATIHTLGGLSAHAGQSGLLRWMSRFSATPRRVALVHGEDRPRAALRDAIAARFGVTPDLPGYGDTIEL